MIEGKDLMMFINVNGSYKAIAMATNCSLSRTTDVVEVTSKISGSDREFEAGMKTWSITTESLIGQGTGVDYEALEEMQDSGAPIDVFFTIRENEGPAKGGRKGKAIITNIVQNAPDEGIATMSVELQGTGKLNKV